jgi:hypothetical protein
VSFQFIVDDIKEVVVAVGKKTVVWWPSPDVQPLQCGVQRGRCRVELLGDIRSGFELRVLLGHRHGFELCNPPGPSERDIVLAEHGNSVTLVKP